MEINKFERNKERILDLNSLGTKLRERRLAIFSLLDEHNTLFELVRKGYLVLGLVKDNAEDPFEPILQSKFLNNPD